MAGSKNTPPEEKARKLAEHNARIGWKPWGEKRTNLTHGATSPTVIEPMAEEIIAWIKEEAARPGSPISFVAEPQFAPALDKWARAEARRLRFEENVEAHGEFDGFGKPRPVLTQLEAWDKRSAYYATTLGLDPASLARIRKDLAEMYREETGVHHLQELQAKYTNKGGRPRKAG